MERKNLRVPEPTMFFYKLQAERRTELVRIIPKRSVCYKRSLNILQPERSRKVYFDYAEVQSISQL